MIDRTPVVLAVIAMWKEMRLIERRELEGDDTAELHPDLPYQQRRVRTIGDDERFDERMADTAVQVAHHMYERDQLDLVRQFDELEVPKRDEAGRLLPLAERLQLFATMALDGYKRVENIPVTEAVPVTATAMEAAMANAINEQHLSVLSAIDLLPARIHQHIDPQIEGLLAQLRFAATSDEVAAVVAEVRLVLSQSQTLDRDEIMIVLDEMNRTIVGTRARLEELAASQVRQPASVGGGGSGGGEAKEAASGRSDQRHSDSYVSLYASLFDIYQSNRLLRGDDKRAAMQRILSHKIIPGQVINGLKEHFRRDDWHFRALQPEEQSAYVLKSLSELLSSPYAGECSDFEIHPHRPAVVRAAAVSALIAKHAGKQAGREIANVAKTVDRSARAFGRASAATAKGVGNIILGIGDLVIWLVRKVVCPIVVGLALAAALIVLGVWMRVAPAPTRAGFEHLGFQHRTPLLMFVAHQEQQYQLDDNLRHALSGYSDYVFTMGSLKQDPSVKSAAKALSDVGVKFDTGILNAPHHHTLWQAYHDALLVDAAHTPLMSDADKQLALVLQTWLDGYHAPEGPKYRFPERPKWHMALNPVQQKLIKMANRSHFPWVHVRPCPDEPPIGFLHCRDQNGVVRTWMNVSNPPDGDVEAAMESQAKQLSDLWPGKCIKRVDWPYLEGVYHFSEESLNVAGCDDPIEAHTAAMKDVNRLSVNTTVYAHQFASDWNGLSAKGWPPSGPAFSVDEWKRFGDDAEAESKLVDRHPQSELGLYHQLSVDVHIWLAKLT